MEYIETYFGGELSPEKMNEFERKITEDPEFAEDVAFYLSLRQVAIMEMTETRERFKDIYAHYKQGNYNAKKQPASIRKFWPWVAAAAVLTGIVFGWNIWFGQVSPQRLANKYVAGHLEILPVTMGNRQDSLQEGLRLYNENKLNEALLQFETMAQQDTSFFEAKKYAGIVSLRLDHYDKAISYFSALEKYTQLYANPGKFYHALTLMKRNQPGDNQAAKILLEQVVQNELEGKQIAQQWLNKW